MKQITLENTTYNIIEKNTAATYRTNGKDKLAQSLESRNHVAHYNLQRPNGKKFYFVIEFKEGLFSQVLKG